MVKNGDVRRRHLARQFAGLRNADVRARNLAIVVALDHDRALRRAFERRLSMWRIRMFAASRLLRWIGGAVAGGGRIGAVEVSRDANQHYCDEKQQAGAHASHIQTHAVISSSLISVGEQTGK